MMKLLMILLFHLILCPLQAFAANWYVDNTATGSHDGTSWANAWTSLASMSGTSSGDTVYISGGPQGSSQTYSVLINPSYPGEWLNVVNGVTYKIGQDSLHNGTAIFDGNAGAAWLVQGWQNVTISGNAGDGVRHFKLTNIATVGNGANWSGIHIEYIDFSDASNGIDLNPATGVEINNCYFYGKGSTLDHVSYAVIQGATWDNSKFHHNLVYVPYSNSTGGIGSDGLQWVGTGFSIYNNTFIAYPTTYTGGQHQDGWQATGGCSYIKVYNNTFTDFTNYAIFPEPAFGGYTNMRIYNNIVTTTNTSDQAIAVSGTDAKPCTSCIVANNITDGNFSYPFTFRNGDITNPGHPNSFLNCGFYNNVSVNGGNNIIDASIPSANNVSITGENAPTNFISWSAGSSSNDLRLKDTAVSLINTGTDLTTYFTTDMLGTVRTVWDIGPYEYTSEYTSGNGTGKLKTGGGMLKIGTGKFH